MSIFWTLGWLNWIIGTDIFGLFYFTLGRCMPVIESPVIWGINNKWNDLIMIKNLKLKKRLYLKRISQTFAKVEKGAIAPTRTWTLIHRAAEREIKDINETAFWN